MPTHRQLDPTAPTRWNLPRVLGGRGRPATDPSDGAADRHDLLTGAGNGHAWTEALDAVISDWASLPITMVRIALMTPLPQAAAADRNEHDPDRNLVLAAVHWQETLRPGDHLARLDGSEFGILLPRCGGSAAEAVVQRLIRAIPDGVISAVGIATWDGDESAEAFQARAEADLDRHRHRLVDDPFDDPARVAAARATGLATRSTYAEFNEVASSVAWLLSTPVAVITLFDEDWQHFIGAHGVAEGGGPLVGTPADDAICRQTISTGRPVVVNDTRRHPVLQHVPPVTDLGVVACASVPITVADDLVIGSVCAMVREHRTWTADDVALLKLTAKRIAERLETVPEQAAA
ncbi:MAG: GAF domain-containing protein [Solirubrobacteraceae bacterium]|nr:GAF domain-containing protein [Patulibacter sp.]